MAQRYECKIALFGSDIYVFGGYDENNNWTSSLEFYSEKINVRKMLHLS